MMENLGDCTFHAAGRPVEVMGSSTDAWSLYLAKPEITSIDDITYFFNNIVSPIVGADVGSIVS
jgi:hypothetical protein